MHSDAIYIDENGAFQMRVLFETSNCTLASNSVGLLYMGILGTSSQHARRLQQATIVRVLLEVSSCTPASGSASSSHSDAGALFTQM